MDFLSFINWNPDPAIFSIGPREIRWYGLFFALSFLFGYYIIQWMFKKERIPLHHLDKLTIYMALGTIIGARLGHVLFYEPDKYLTNPIEIIKIWEGGLASHGAAIGIITSLILYSRRVSKRSVLWILDRIVIVVALSGLFIRSGNLMNSEIVGAETEVSWGFVFPRNDQNFEVLMAQYQGDDVELTFSPQNQRAAANFDIWRSHDEVNWTTVGQFQTVPTGKKAAQYTFVDRNQPPTRVNYQILRAWQPTTHQVAAQDSNDQRRVILMHTLSGDTNAFQGQWEAEGLSFSLRTQAYPRNRKVQVMRSYDNQNWTPIHKLEVPNGGINTTFIDPVVDASQSTIIYRTVSSDDTYERVSLYARHPAQLYEAGAYFLIFFLLIWLYRRQDGKVPLGQIFGLFLILVFTARFLIEFVKELQEGWEEGLPLNMGQMLSIPFVLAGIYFFITSRNRPSELPPYPESEFRENKK